jgi:hypothetical protein
MGDRLILTVAIVFCGYVSALAGLALFSVIGTMPGYAISVVMAVIVLILGWLVGMIVFVMMLHALDYRLVRTKKRPYLGRG